MAPAQAAPPAAPAPEPVEAAAPAEELKLQPGQPPEPAGPVTTDDAVAQTLSLFPGSQEVLPPEQNHQ